MGNVPMIDTPSVRGLFPVIAVPYENRLAAPAAINFSARRQREQYRLTPPNSGTYTPIATDKRVHKRTVPFVYFFFFSEDNWNNDLEYNVAPHAVDALTASAVVCVTVFQTA